MKKLTLTICVSMNTVTSLSLRSPDDFLCNNLKPVSLDSNNTWKSRTN